tara:strand:- start:43 stop:1362 length:1320 start_codon:yes stop_codon:yes gene_type:complete
MVMDWASAKAAMTSGPAYTYNVGAGHSSNDPPGQHVWEEDKNTYESPIIPTHEIINKPVVADAGDPYGSASDLDKWLESEKTDYLGGNLVSNMSNEEIASYSPGQTYNPNTGNIESSYNVPEHDAMSISQSNYNKYGDNLGNWPTDAKLQAKKSGFFGAQAEGMLGGVTGGEQDINALKETYLKGVTEGGTSWGPAMEALKALTALQGGNEEMAKMSALGIQKYLERESKGTSKAFEDIVTGKTKIEGLENFDFEKFIGQTGGLDWGTEKGKLQGDAMGYDPSGVYTWGDVESDPWLSEAYYGLTTGDPEDTPDWLYDKYLKTILYHGNPPGEDSWDSWEDPWDQWGQGTGGGGGMDTMADMARSFWRSESLADVEAREQQRVEEGLGVATMADMEQIYGKSFAAKANPYHDPGFSLDVTSELDPHYADLKLWQEARQA